MTVPGSPRINHARIAKRARLALRDRRHSEAARLGLLAYEVATGQVAVDREPVVRDLE